MIQEPNKLKKKKKLFRTYLYVFFVFFAIFISEILTTIVTTFRDEIILWEGTFNCTLVRTFCVLTRTKSKSLIVCKTAAITVDVIRKK